jgi:hypothetical protein
MVADNRVIMKMKTTEKVALIAASLAALFVARVLPAAACATLAPRPEDAVVVTDESAVIVWDEAKKREHFIRGATFQGTAKDIGFLVPSPSTPELKAADRGAFNILKKALEPKTEYRTKYEWQWSIIPFGGGADGDAERVGMRLTAVRPLHRGTTGVEVLQTQTVAGYDATTLKAKDTSALNRWLNKNGYLANADFRDWLAPYIKRGWVITAFKIRKTDKDSKQFATSLVRMSFDADKPFFPYREPAHQRAGIAKKTPRSLRVFFISDQRMVGALGEMEKRAWPGQTKWSDDLANHLDQTQRAQLLKDLAMKPAQLPNPLRMTSFEDYSSPRPGFDDVYFAPAMQQETMTPPPIILSDKRTIVIPLDLIFAGCVLLFFMGRARLRRR